MDELISNILKVAHSRLNQPPELVLPSKALVPDEGSAPASVKTPRVQNVCSQALVALNQALDTLD